MKKTRIPPMSKKKREQIKDERPARIAICERAGGEWLYKTDGFGVRLNSNEGVCIGGLCEICHRPPCGPDWLLHPHEKLYRSRGGKLTEENSLMVCNICHTREH